MPAFRFIASAVLLIGGACLAYVVGSLLRVFDPMGDWDGRAVALIAGSTLVIASGAKLWLLADLVAWLRRKQP